MKNVLVLGATGPTGRQVVSQALERGHRVRVLVRNPGKLGPIDDRIQVVRGSLPEDKDALAETLRGQDAVVSALGVGNSLKPAGLIERSMPAIVQAWKEAACAGWSLRPLTASAQRCARFRSSREF